jgi:hypothetical protein
MKSLLSQRRDMLAVIALIIIICIAFPIIGSFADSRVLSPITPTPTRMPTPSFIPTPTLVPTPTEEPTPEANGEWRITNWQSKPL